jgi:hypothetical protein
MQVTRLCLALMGCTLLTAQGQQWQQQPMVRSITMRLITTHTEASKPIALDAITSAWKNRQVKLAVEHPLDVASIEGAKEVIREMYSANGREVKVDHRINSIPPRSAEVSFEIIELCPEH